MNWWLNCLRGMRGILGIGSISTGECFWKKKVYLLWKSLTPAKLRKWGGEFLSGIEGNLASELNDLRCHITLGISGEESPSSSDVGMEASNENARTPNYPVSQCFTVFHSLLGELDLKRVLLARGTTSNVQNWMHFFLCKVSLPKITGRMGSKKLTNGLPKVNLWIFFWAMGCSWNFGKMLGSDITWDFFHRHQRRNYHIFLRRKTWIFQPWPSSKNHKQFGIQPGGVLGNSHSQDFLQLYQSLRTRMDIFIEVIYTIQPTVRDGKKQKIIFHCCLIGIPIYNGIL